MLDTAPAAKRSGRGAETRNGPVSRGTIVSTHGRYRAVAGGRNGDSDGEVGGMVLGINLRLIAAPLDRAFPHFHQPRDRVCCCGTTRFSVAGGHVGFSLTHSLTLERTWIIERLTPEHD